MATLTRAVGAIGASVSPEHEWPTLDALKSKVCSKAAVGGKSRNLAKNNAHGGKCIVAEELKEVETTDPESGESEAESTCSSTCASVTSALSDEGQGSDDHQRSKSSTFRGRFKGARLEEIGGTPASLSRHSLAAPSEPNTTLCSQRLRGLVLQPRSHATLCKFTGTKLETIPGTPCAVEEQQSDLVRVQPMPSVVAAPPADVLVKPPAAIPPPPVGSPALPHALWTSPPPPQRSPQFHDGHMLAASLPQAPSHDALQPHELFSPKRRAREATLSRARKEEIPVKVRAPEGTSSVRKDLNPLLPVKKRLVFQELASITQEAMAKLPRSEPVKKKLTAFLLQEPKSVMCPPPGLPVVFL